MELDIYLRVSRFGDEKQRSIEGQEHDSRARIADAGATVGEVHKDRGRSAWNPRVRRAGWDTLMARLESGATDGVVVFDLERFSRQPLEGERLLSAAGNGLRVLDSDSEYDLTSPSGRKAFRDQMAAAAYYSDRLSSRTRRGKRIKAASGEVDRRRSFGFCDDGVTVDDAEAAIIRECAERLLAGETQQAIMRDLTARGVATVKGAEWGYTTFRQIMLRPRNAGLVHYKGKVVEGVRLPGEPILDGDTYARIVAMYAARRPGRPPLGRYVLTGIAVCGRCGTGLSGRPDTRQARREYWCKECHGISADVIRLDEWAGDWAIGVLSDSATASAIESEARELDERRAGLEREVSSRKELKLLLADRLGRGELELDEYDAAAKPIADQIAHLRAELDELDKLAASMAGLGSGGSGYFAHAPRDAERLTLLEVWTGGTTADRKQVVKAALRGRRIVVGPGRRARFNPARVTVV